MRSLVLPISAALLLCLPLVAQVQVASSPLPDPRTSSPLTPMNIGRAGAANYGWSWLDGLMRVDGDYAAFRIDECYQNEDINGNGVLCADNCYGEREFSIGVHNLTTGTTTNIGHTSYLYGFDGGLLLHATACEIAYPYLGDVRLFDVSTGTDSLVAADAWAVYGVQLPRLAAGLKENGVDLNGDGDGLDIVLHTFDAQQLTSHNVGLAVSSASSTGRLIAFTVPEAGQGADLNGDGDQNDRVLHLVDVVTSAVLNIGLTSDTWRQSNNLIMAMVSEADDGPQDWNGDGDFDDFVPFVYDIESGVTTNLGLAMKDYGAIFSLDEFAAWRADESEAQADLNGDGDLLDDVVQVFNRATGTTLNTGADGLIQSAEGGIMTVIEGYLQGGYVWQLRVVDLASGRSRLFEVPDNSAEYPISKGRIALALVDSNDRNGNGSTNDQIAAVYEPATGRLHSFPQSVDEVFFDFGGDATLLALEGDDLVFASSEWTEKRDLDGDGDMRDRVLMAVQVPRGGKTLGRNDLRVIGPMYFASAGSIEYGGNFVVEDGVVLYDHSEGDWTDSLFANPSYLPGPDLNGDGDGIDPVLHFVRLR